MSLVKQWTRVQEGRFHLRNRGKKETVDQYVDRICPGLSAPDRIGKILRVWELIDLAKKDHLKSLNSKGAKS